MVASQYGLWALIQWGGWHCLACLLFGVLKVATLQLQAAASAPASM